MLEYTATFTDTFSGEPNYSWVKRATIRMPELIYYGYDGTNYVRANKIFRRELMRKAKKKFGLSGVRGVTEEFPDGSFMFRPSGSSTVLIIEEFSKQ